MASLSSSEVHILSDPQQSELLIQCFSLSFIPFVSVNITMVPVMLPEYIRQP